MILADKIIKLRKNNAWSQEELADKMNVSRQAVSKWESAQSIPDLEKLLQLSILFGVTTDYLLKDEIENEKFTDTSQSSSIKRITLQEAKEYLDQRKSASWQIAIATFLCILSPLTLIILTAISEIQNIGLSEEFASIVGLIMLFVFILCAVPIFIYCGFKNEPFSFLDKNIPFELEYNAENLVIDRKKQFRNIYIKWNIIATCICIFSPVPLIVSAFSNKDMLHIIMLSISMIIAGIGAAIFIIFGIQNASIQKLLKEKEYTEKEKIRNELKEPLGLAYWGIIITVYLSFNFISNSWHISWLIFVVGIAMFPVVMYICNITSDRTNKN